MSTVEIIALAAAGAAAGMVNAVAGGGTLITFPALLAFGMPSITANATSTLALVIGTAGSAYGYRQQISQVKVWLRRYIPVSLLGGLLGGILLTHTKESTFARMVPFLLLFATFLFMGQGPLKRLADAAGLSSATGQSSRRAIWLAGAFQFLVALYGGYFGAGIGILMLATLGCLGLSDIHQMNGIKTILGSLINLVAALYFVGSGLIDWPRMGIMTAGALIGYFAGAHYSQQIPQQWVRRIITAIGFTISAVIFYRQFLQPA